MRETYSATKEEGFLLKAFLAFGKSNHYSTIRLVDLLQVDLGDAWRLLVDWERAGYVSKAVEEKGVHNRYRVWFFTAKAEVVCGRMSQ
jgi:hypothetical protein